MKASEDTVQERFHGGTYNGHCDDDDDRDKARDQAIFDCGGATIVGGESFHSRSRNMGSSGKSAAGMG